MFKSMNIPRKLGLSFLVICASAAIMMIVFCINIAMIRLSTDQNNEAQAIHAKALNLETAILRQNSQFRGFLVTGDASYLKSYYEARDDFDRTSVALENQLTDPAQRQLVRDARAGTLQWRANWGDKLIDWVKQGRRTEAEDEVRKAGKAALVTKPVLQLRQIRDTQVALIDHNSARQETAITTAWITLALGGLALIGVAVTLAVMLSRAIARPITGLTQAMAELAAGNNSIRVPDTDRQDELGDMARAVLVFRDAAIAKLAGDADLQRSIEEIGKTLHGLSDADLTVRLTGLPDSFQSLARDFNDAVERLSDAMRTVRGSVDSITNNSGEIRQAANDLANRSEHQAASLRGSAAAMDEITHSVRDGALLANTASRDMAEARSEAEQGGVVVRQAIEAMNGIDQASKEIAEIITVIDGIAFQTNLLALNAGVEAARAGDAGKGFAVVASEVRALAQRAADAAKDVKSRVTSATQHVKAGVELVDETGNALTRIIARVSSVGEAIASMAVSSERQATSLTQVNQAIGEMDSVTQQNAAMVEETTAAAAMLAKEAEQLASAVAIFKLGGTGWQNTETPSKAVFAGSAAPSRVLGDTGATVPFRRRAATPSGGQAAKVSHVSGNLALNSAEEDWSEF